MDTTTTSPVVASAVIATIDDNHPIVLTLRKIDPIIQFLTKATGYTSILLSTIKQSLPTSLFSDNENEFIQNLIILINFGILHIDYNNNNDELSTITNHNNDIIINDNVLLQQLLNSWNNNNATTSDSAAASTTCSMIRLGFPPPTTESHDDSPEQKIKNKALINGSLHGSTKTAARRRLAALKRFLKADIKNQKINKNIKCDNKIDKNEILPSSSCIMKKDNSIIVSNSNNNNNNTVDGPFISVSDNKLNDATITSNHNNSIVSTTKENDEELDDRTTNNIHEEKVVLMSLNEINARSALCNIFGFKEEQQKEEDKFNDPENIKLKSTTKQTTTTAASTKLVSSNKTIKLESNYTKDTIPCQVLKHQISYAGSNSSQDSIYGTLPNDVLQQIPNSLLKAFGIIDDDMNHNNNSKRRLFSHQVSAINAAISGKHCIVSTGTGSGKSLCFLLPVLTAAYNDNSTSILLYPTKALAQDQLSKLTNLLNDNNDLQNYIRPMTLDGDTPHSARINIAETANIILTNPDTLHNTILPNWKTSHYTHMLSSLKYIIIDESHMYEGIFGSHVSCILRRLIRCCTVAQCNTGNNDNILPIFLAASATLLYPEQHFKQLCPISNNDNIVVITNKDDGSPRSAKHFFLWNPPIVDMAGMNTGSVEFPKSANTDEKKLLVSNTSSDYRKRKRGRPMTTTMKKFHNESPIIQRQLLESLDGDETISNHITIPRQQHYGGRHYIHYRRQHAADETALLLARAVICGIRCIAFCKTRNVVEWVYSKTLDALKKDSSTAHLANKVESYRGGYNVMERRQIEKRLFHNDILGVVGTNALELGVDIGGIDLTLHCGYPTSYTSLLQQAGRAGRSKEKESNASLSIVICFASPVEQHIWRNPHTLLGQSISITPNLIPFTPNVVQGHLLCASDEFPLTGKFPLTALFGNNMAETIENDFSANHDSSTTNIDDNMSNNRTTIRSDSDLFGEEHYNKALPALIESRSVLQESVVISVNNKSRQLQIYRAHASLQKPASRVSIRSIEPVQFSLVNLAHPTQNGRMDRLHDEKAQMDTIPYSRVFYCAHPGAIIQHRAQKYKIISMTRPPPYVDVKDNYRKTYNLAAFARPCNAKYLTRPLSKLQVTVVRQIDSVELRHPCDSRVVPSTNELPNDDGAQMLCKEVNEELLAVPEKASEQIHDKCNTSTIAGCGIVSVKREVHGYKTLSLIDYSELSREELSLPPIEYDTFGVYLCLDFINLKAFLGDTYGPGVHGLSHAILAVAPLFGPGIVRSDMDCDHSIYDPKHVMIFDERAGGSGTVARLWKSFFCQSNNILDAALDLLLGCSSCKIETDYDGGCPACLHAANCMKFNLNMSRSAAIVIAKRTIQMIKRTEAYKCSALEKTIANDIMQSQQVDAKDTTPRRKSRNRALQKAKDMEGASERQFVIGRPSWPLGD